MSEATKEKLRVKAKARHAAELLDPNYKPKSVKVKKERKRKVGHLTLTLVVWLNSGRLVLNKRKK